MSSRRKPNSNSDEEGKKKTFITHIKGDKGWRDTSDEEEEDDNPMDQNINEACPEAEEAQRRRDLPSTSREGMSNQLIEDERRGVVPNQPSTSRHGSDNQSGTVDPIKNIVRKKSCLGPTTKKSDFPIHDHSNSLSAVKKDFIIPPLIRRSPNLDTEIVDEEKFRESIEAEMPKETTLKSKAKKRNKRNSSSDSCSNFANRCCVSKQDDSEQYQYERVDDRCILPQASESFITPNPESNIERTKQPEQKSSCRIAHDQIHSSQQSSLVGLERQAKNKSIQSSKHPYKKTRLTRQKQPVDTKSDGTQKLSHASQLAEKERKSRTSSSGSQQNLTGRSKSVGQERQGRNLSSRKGAFHHTTSSPERKPKSKQSRNQSTSRKSALAEKEQTTATTSPQTLNPPQSQFLTERRRPSENQDTQEGSSRKKGIFSPFKHKKRSRSRSPKK